MARYRVVGVAKLEKSEDFKKDGFVASGKFVPHAAIDRVVFTKDGTTIILKENWRNNEDEREHCKPSQSPA